MYLDKYVYEKLKLRLNVYLKNSTYHLKSASREEQRTSSHRCRTCSLEKQDILVALICTLKTDLIGTELEESKFVQQFPTIVLNT